MVKQGLILFIIINLTACWSYQSRQVPVQKGLLHDKINGMAIMAPPNPFEKNPMPDLKSIGINYVSLQPFAFFLIKISLTLNMMVICGGANEKKV